MGIEWGTKIFTAYVRESRFTRELLDRTGEFTICLPYGENKNSQQVTKALGICGNKSGRDTDKFAESKLTLLDAEEVRSPAIKEFPLTIECRVVFQEVQQIKKISSQFAKFYSKDDPHIAYYGEILKAYIIEE